MKKVLSLLLVLGMALSLCACGAKDNKAPETDINAKSEGVMTYAEYTAAADDTEVTIEAYVQAKENWWDNAATIYAQDGDGAYLLYNLPCTEEEFNKFEVGTKLKVKGYKSTWDGQVEIVDGTFEIEEGSYVAEAFDATSLLGTDELVNHMTQLVTFKGLTVEAANDEGAAFLYNWDGSGSEGDHVYFNVSLNGKTYSFNVRSYLCGPDTEVYKAATALEVGQTIDVECFLYYYAGEPQPRVTSITVK